LELQTVSSTNVSAPAGYRGFRILRECHFSSKFDRLTAAKVGQLTRKIARNRPFLPQTPETKPPYSPSNYLAAGDIKATYRDFPMGAATFVLKF
jgi:hypothetical protein